MLSLFQVGEFDFSLCSLAEKHPEVSWGIRSIPALTTCLNRFLLLLAAQGRGCVAVFDGMTGVIAPDFEF